MLPQTACACSSSNAADDMPHLLPGLKPGALTDKPWLLGVGYSSSDDSGEVVSL